MSMGGNWYQIFYVTKNICTHKLIKNSAIGLPYCGFYSSFYGSNVCEGQKKLLQEGKSGEKYYDAVGLFSGPTINCVGKIYNGNDIS